MATQKAWVFLLSSLLLFSTTSGCWWKTPSTEESHLDELLEDSQEAEDLLTPEEKLLFDTEPDPPIDTYRPISVTVANGTKLVGKLYIPGITPYDPTVKPETPVTPKDSETEKTASKKTEKGKDTAKPAAPKKPPVPKTQYPLVILLHSWNSDQWEWKDYPKHLVEQGYAVLTFDLRGHGKSVYQGALLSVWRQFDKSDWQKMHDDIRYFLREIGNNLDYNQVSIQHVALIGSDLGANLALKFGAKFPKNVSALILISPGLEYKTVETTTAAKAYPGPVYFLASQDDSYSADSTQKLYELAPGKKKIQIFKDLGHGTKMLENDPELITETLNWLKSVYSNKPQKGIAGIPKAYSSPVLDKEDASKDSDEDAKKPVDDEKKPDAEKPAQPLSQKPVAPEKRPPAEPVPQPVQPQPIPAPITPPPPPPPAQLDHPHPLPPDPSPAH